MSKLRLLERTVEVTSAAAAAYEGKSRFLADSLLSFDSLIVFHWFVIGWYAAHRLPHGLNGTLDLYQGHISHAGQTFFGAYKARKGILERAKGWFCGYGK